MQAYRDLPFDNWNPEFWSFTRYFENLANRQAQPAAHSHAHLEPLLQQRGFINRLLGGRLHKLMNHSWQMYPLGFLFGLGFDTASEVGYWR